jgi:hypothetical protein
MAEVARTTRKQSMKMASVIAGTALGLNSIFWVLSIVYYDDKPGLAAANIDSVRIAFFALTLLVAAMSYVAGLAPRHLGHGVGFVAGIASLVAGFASFGSTIPGVVGATLLVFGFILPIVTWKSLQHSRAAWAFLIALLSVLATVTFFGAPKVRHVLGIGLWYAMIIPAVEIVAVIALSMVRGEYRERA